MELWCGIQTLHLSQKLWYVCFFFSFYIDRAFICLRRIRFGQVLAYAKFLVGHSFRREIVIFILVSVMLAHLQNRKMLVCCFFSLSLKTHQAKKVGKKGDSFLFYLKLFLWGRKVCISLLQEKLNFWMICKFVEKEFDSSAGNYILRRNRY